VSWLKQEAGGDIMRLANEDLFTLPKSGVFGLARLGAKSDAKEAHHAHNGEESFGVQFNHGFPFVIRR